MPPRASCTVVTWRALSLRARCVGEWILAGFQPGRREDDMASKDKGGRAAKTPAAKSAKEKRQSKKEKKASKSKAGLVP